MAYSPAEIFLGRKFLSSLDLELSTEVQAEEYSLEAYAQHLCETTPGVTKFVQESQERYHSRMDQTARNRARRKQDFKIGDLVKLYKKPRAKRTVKLWRKWQAPYKVIKVHNSGATFTLKHVAYHDLFKNQNAKDIFKYYAADGTAVPEAERRRPCSNGAATPCSGSGRRRPGHTWCRQTVQDSLGGRLGRHVGSRKKIWAAHDWYKHITADRPESPQPRSQQQ